ncbi:putative membrane protein [Thiogranum longum]|uniref:Putative membrane protein n=1 Tax=Thiogranum longum TaxID=1537524 RepID=A0A4R1HNX6_9GAMM|nr:heparan-alpha-glucosaminide N-acetyltransferase [Thiogranum longum]TCK18982.1 putative membrane protein [Thiogranum longum]
MSSPGENSSDFRRLVIVDVMRGMAIALMVIYHFCFDLAHFGFARFDFYHDAFWLNFRTFILSLFLFLVGLSLVLSTQKGINVRRFTARLIRIIGAALLVSVATWWMFGDRFVFFGVLHFIALASLLGLLFVRKPVIALVLGIALLVIGNSVQFPGFDQTGWRWIGLMTHKPATEDYVPLLPWFGVVLAGIFAGNIVLRERRLERLDGVLPSGNTPVRLLAFSGRHSLLIYLLHQPLLFGVISLYAAMAGR